MDIDYFIQTLSASAIEDELHSLERAGYQLWVAIGARSNQSTMELADAYGLRYLVDRIREIVAQIAAALASRPDLHPSLVDAAEVERHIIWLCLQVQAGYVEPEDSPCC